MLKFLPSFLFSGLGIVMLWQIVSAPQLRNIQIGDPGPWFFPSTLAIVLIGLGIVLGIGEHKRSNSQVEKSDQNETVDNISSEQPSVEISMLAPPSIFVRVVILLAVIGYVFLFERAGFSIATTIFLCITTVALSPKKPATIAIAITTSILATLLIGWLLADVVNVPLQGVFFS